MRLPPLVLGLAEAGETLVSHHWLRLEKSDSFPLPLFLKAWYEFTVNQVRTARAPLGKSVKTGVCRTILTASFAALVLGVTY